METKFQTSFIPKRPLVSVGGAAAGAGFAPNRPRRTGSAFFNASVLLFIVSLGLAGGMYAWKSVTLANQDDLKLQLAERQKQFNPDLIAELKGINVKIDAAKQLITRHLAISNVFDVISKMTIEKVRFNSLDLTGPNTQSNDIKISMNGYGIDLSAVAFQSDVLGELEQFGLRNIVKNPILSNPVLEATGAVSFGFSASIDPTTLSYENSVSGTASSSPFNNPQP
jgi:hypothetical protein